MIRQAITKNSILLGLFAIVVAGGLAVTEVTTRDARAASLRKVQSAALEAIIPPARHDNVLLDDSIVTDDHELLKLKKPKTIHIARKDGEVVAFIIPTVAPDGYGGAVESIVGVNLDGSIAGVRVIKHQETPGLGDRIELKKSNWVLSFIGKALGKPETDRWKVKKDKGVFDQFTGATITPRAVITSIHNSLLFYQQHQKTLLEQARALATHAANTPSDTQEQAQ